MTVQSSEAAKRAEKKLDSVYLAILKLYSKDTILIKNLKISQIFWKKYYAVQVKVMFHYYPDQSAHYGSMKSMCVTSYARRIVELRIRELEKWLIGNEQDDCDSSVKPQKYLPEYKPYMPFNPSAEGDQNN
jgi:hypothetical protein